MWQPRSPGRVSPPGKGFLHNAVDPAQLSLWLDRDDLTYMVGEFQRTGFRGGLNWYRAIRLGWELMAPWCSAVIHQPSLFIGGERDDVLKKAVAQQHQRVDGLAGHTYL